MVILSMVTLYLWCHHYSQSRWLGCITKRLIWMIQVLRMNFERFNLLFELPRYDETFFGMFWSHNKWGLLDQDMATGVIAPHFSLVALTHICQELTQWYCPPENSKKQMTSGCQVAHQTFLLFSVLLTGWLPWNLRWL